MSRVSSKNKGKQVKRKNSVKKQRPLNRKKKTTTTTKKRKTASPGVEPGLSAQWHTWFEKLVLLYQNHFSVCQRPEIKTLFEADGAVFIMNSSIHSRKISLSAYISKLFCIISVSTGRSMWIIDRTSFTEFGGQLGDQQRLTLERIDMKLGRFN